jgi:hypothetical protein
MSVVRLGDRNADCHESCACYAQKPDNIDFVGSSKIGSFSQNPPSALWWYFSTLTRTTRFSSRLRRNADICVDPA